MAFFLDPELAALCAAPQKAPTAKIVPNRFPKPCDGGCGKYVAAGEGRLEKKDRAWRVYHLAC